MSSQLITRGIGLIPVVTVYALVCLFLADQSYAGRLSSCQKMLSTQEQDNNEFKAMMRKLLDDPKGHHGNALEVPFIGGHTFTQLIMNLASDDEPNIRIANSIRQATLRQRVETGAYRFVFKGASDTADQYAGNSINEIDGDQVIKPIHVPALGQRIMSGEKLRYVVNFHTHPISMVEGDFDPIINSTDFDSYLEMQKEIEKLYGVSVPIIGIVIPICEGCDSTYFMTIVHQGRGLIEMDNLPKSRSSERSTNILYHYFLPE